MLAGINIHSIRRLVLSFLGIFFLFCSSGICFVYLLFLICYWMHFDFLRLKKKDQFMLFSGFIKLLSTCVFSNCFVSSKYFNHDALYDQRWRCHYAGCRLFIVSGSYICAWHLIVVILLLAYVRLWLFYEGEGLGVVVGVLFVFLLCVFCKIGRLWKCMCLYRGC